MANTNKRGSAKMKRCAMVPFLLFFATVAAQEVEFNSAVSEFLENANHEEYNSALNAWSALKPDEKEAAWPQMALASIVRAEQLIQEGQPTEASQALVAASGIAQEQEGRLAFLTKSPEDFFRRLAVIHASVADALGDDPLEGAVDYYFSKNGNGYKVARKELYDEVQGVSVDLGEDQSLVYSLDVMVEVGLGRIINSEWLIGTGASVKAIVEAPQKRMAQDSYGRFVAVDVDEQSENNSVAPAHTASEAGTPKTSSSAVPQSEMHEENQQFRYLPVLLVVLSLGLVISLLVRRK